MSGLSKEQLAELTEQINARLAEFDVSCMPKLSRGAVRVAHDMVKKFYEEKGEAWAMQRISEVTIAAEAALKLSEQGYERGYAKGQQETGNEFARLYPHLVGGVDSKPKTVTDWPYQGYARDANGTVSAGATTDEDVGPDTGLGAGRGPVEDVVGQAFSGDNYPDSIESLHAQKVQAWRDAGFNVTDPHDETDPATQMDYAEDDEPELDADNWLDEEFGVSASPPPIIAPLPEPTRVPIAPDPDVARDNVATALATGSGGDLARAISQPRTLAEVDGATERKRGAKINLDMLIAEVKRQAMGGTMPTQSNFDDAKPATWPTATWLITALGISWQGLAQQAGLKPNRRER